MITQHNTLVSECCKQQQQQQQLPTKRKKNHKRNTATPIPRPPRSPRFSSKEQQTAAAAVAHEDREYTPQADDSTNDVYTHTLTWGRITIILEHDRHIIYIRTLKDWTRKSKITFHFLCEWASKLNIYLSERSVLSRAKPHQYVRYCCCI